MVLLILIKKIKHIFQNIIGNLTLKKIITGLVVFVILSICFVLFCNISIEKFSKGKVFYKIKNIPNNRVGVLLGTSKRVKNGRLNLYFKYRIDAAVVLYKTKKIKYILVSGDNRTLYYNEPKDMKKELVKRGVRPSDIFLDAAGIRTLHSMVRAKKVFGLNEFTVISQSFHNKRAIYIADSYGINAIGFNAKDVPLKRQSMKVKIREIFARVWVFIDLIFADENKFASGMKKVI